MLKHCIVEMVCTTSMSIALLEVELLLAESGQRPRGITRVYMLKLQSYTILSHLMRMRTACYMIQVHLPRNVFRVL